MSEHIKWQTPPPKRSAGPTSRFVEALKTRPGEWALYPTTMASAASTSSYKKNYPGSEWTVRKRDDGRYDMYGRWVGES